MAKKNTPIITHTEIICLAIEAVQARIRAYDDIVEKASGKGADVQKTAAEIRDTYVADATPKLAVLKSMYKIETGTDYN